MNKKRLSRLRSVLGKVEELKRKAESTKDEAAKIANDIQLLQGDVETLQDEEQMAHDNLPDPIQWSEKGEKMQEIADALEYAAENLGEAASNIEGALNQS